MPQGLLGLPLVLTCGALAFYRLRRWLLGQLVPLFVVLFPLMGLTLPSVTSSDGGAPKLRIVSQNADSGHQGYLSVARDVLAFDPDILLLQELFIDPEKLVVELRKRFPHVHVSTQFLIASRFLISETTDPPKIDYGSQRSPRFMRYVVDTPLGRVALYNAHPLSPRESIRALRGDGLRSEVKSGRLFSGASAPTIQANAGLRVLQIRQLGAMSRAEKLPVIVAGDLNLPSLSPEWTHLSFLNDGFCEASSGFGYTYPRKRPFLRLDRILASKELSFTRFETACKQTSDHLCVVAELQRKRP